MNLHPIPSSTPRRPHVCHGARTLLALAAAGCAFSAQAVPVSVSISGLPAGLSPVLTAQRNVCPDGMGWVSNPSQPLCEQSAMVTVNSTLARGMVHTVDAGHAASLGSVTGQRIDLLRPSTLIAGTATRAARIFVRHDGIGCVQSRTTTRCLGEPTLFDAGGMLLHALQRPVSGQPGVVRFQFELMHGFPTGTLKLRAAADASDLAAYPVDGKPQPLDLLPWQAMEQTVAVQ